MNNNYELENQLILLLIKERTPEEEKYLPELISKNLDWQYILEKAQQEGIFYPLAEQLFHLDLTKQLPNQDMLNRFRQIYYLYLSQGGYFHQKVKQVLDYLNSLKINILVIKGPTIDYLIYKDNFFRPRLDLDLVVRNRDLSILEQRLFDNGYTLKPTIQDYPIPEYLNSHILVKGDNDILPLHIHLHIINNIFLMLGDKITIDIEEIWQEAESFQKYDYIFCLPGEWQILYLCDHSLKHDFEQLVHLYEIDQLIRYYQGRLNWDRFILYANKFNLSQIVYYGLHLTKEILTTPIPEEVLTELRPLKFSWGEKEFIRRTLARQPIKYFSFWVYIRRHKTLLKRLHFILETIFPPHFTFAQYLLRIKRGIALLVSLKN